ncbi:MAG: O-antigen ligase family protein [Thermoleophilia bacterium]
MTTHDIRIAGERPPAVPSWKPLVAVLAAIMVVAVAFTDVVPLLEVTFLVVAGLALAFAHRVLLSWPVLLSGIALVIMFIPIRRYTIPVELPFELEPYRILVAFIVIGWGACLLADPRVTLRRSGFEAPIAVIVVGVVGSVLSNPGRVAELSTDVVKDLTFLASFLLLFYLIVSVVRTRRAIDILLGTLVLSGAVVGLFALIESRTRWNVFNQLGGVVPFLDNAALPDEETRGGRLRVFGSAQHPIALGAALVVLLPFAVYLARRSARRIWWVPAAMLTLGAFSTVSRTSIVMLGVAAITFFILRPKEVRKFAIPALVLLPVLVHLALPGTLGSLKKSFFPEGGLIADQERAAGQRGAGRVADLGPAFDELAKSPAFGQGYGTRITDADRANAQILDNQWLKTLLETGVIGALGWFWLIVAIVRRLGRAAKEDPSPDGWLPTACAASIAAFAVGMFTYDAFSFIQVTLLLFIALAVGACTLRLGEHEARAPATAPGSAAGPARA